MKDPGKTELDKLTLNIELTLISIIQGVALYFLTESSRALLIERQFQYWPYILLGLITLFTFWSRSILHTLTVIQWPLDFPHTFIYFVCTLLEAVVFTQVQNPLHWFFLNAAYTIAILALFIFDLRMIQQAAAQSSPASRPLFEAVEKDQWKNILFLNPGYLFFNLICAWCILRNPQFFLEKRGHLVLAGLQLIGSLGYLLYSIRLFKRLSPLIQRHRAEQQSAP